MQSRLDETDIIILRTLQEDGRITNADLARRIGLSPPSMLQRVRKLEESGFIRRYTAVLSEEALGYSIQVLAMVSLALHQDEPISLFRDAVLKIPEVLECWHISGEHDFILRIIAKDVADYERIVTSRLSCIKQVAKINSSFILHTSKSTANLPL